MDANTAIGSLRSHQLYFSYCHQKGRKAKELEKENNVRQKVHMAEEVWDARAHRNSSMGQRFVSWFPITDMV